MDLETLFLDAGGVLVHPNWARVREALARQGIAVDATALAGAEPRAKRALDVPAQVQSSDDESRGEAYFKLVLAGAGVAPGPGVDAALAELRRYHEGWNLWESVPDEVVPALDRFRAAGLRLVVVSNANGTLVPHLERLGLASRFDHILDSRVEGVEKPDPRIFQIALERSGARPETTVHVGDLYHVDVVGARAAGLRAILLDPAGLYADHDCPRVGSLGALAEALAVGRS